VQQQRWHARYGDAHGALSWDQYQGKGEIIGKYFSSFGTGKVNVIFEPD